MSRRVSDSATIRRAVSGPARCRILATAASSTFAGSPVLGCANPSPMSVELALALSRSFTCLRKSETTNPSRATGTVQRNTVCRVSAYAWARGAVCPAGSACTA